MRPRSYAYGTSVNHAAFHAENSFTEFYNSLPPVISKYTPFPTHMNTHIHACRPLCTHAHVHTHTLENFLKILPNQYTGLGKKLSIYTLQKPLKRWWLFKKLEVITQRKKTEMYRAGQECNVNSTIHNATKIWFKGMVKSSKAGIAAKCKKEIRQMNTHTKKCLRIYGTWH